MNNIQEQKTYIYYDKNINDFSNTAIGYLIRAIGDGLNIAYIDSSNTANKLVNFIENLSLSYTFRKNLNNFHVDIFNLKDDKKVLKTIIPQVEYSAILYDKFWQSLNNYDLVIFDNLNLEKISKIKIESLLINKNPKTQFLVFVKDKNSFKDIKDFFNYKIECMYTNQKGLIVKKGLINIYGNSKGKSMYAFGYLIRNFIFKKNVKLIYFDKGDNFYGDAIFFKQLKKWNIENNLYGNFDFVKTGIKRYKFGQFRNIVNVFDIKEAKDALILLDTALKKHTPIVADELNNMLNLNIITENEILNVLNNIKNELVITGDDTSKKLKEISQTLIQFKNI